VSLRFLFLTLIVCTFAVEARALDKQGSAHGGQPGGAASGFGLSGSLLGGVSLINPTYAARPSNTGRALFRLAPHMDVDLIGSRLSIPIDLNFFTDRLRPGLGKLVPSEMDIISGVTSTWPLGPTAIEFGVRVEGDFSLDRNECSEKLPEEVRLTGCEQVYGDARTRWLVDFADLVPGLSSALGGGGLAGAATLGWFAVNPSYAARPDNSGRAFLRYALHLTLHYTERFFVGLDATFFTDRRTNVIAPSELDFTPELGVTVIDGLDVHLAYERDMPVDQGGRVQQFVMLFITWDFTLVDNKAG
jgi:hypothetical protein